MTRRLNGSYFFMMKGPKKKKRKTVDLKEDYENIELEHLKSALSSLGTVGALSSLGTVAIYDHVVVA
ncbi:hypothetical protein DPMN_104896 [Dreissena polymorpha]|uniref:Uncharacterized protein n=1 Tax=Dreissena polymorpha TaxID=45954 RepID=A0A9D4HDX2_DREPO|nr:hypothetical protein DPMN_104896 [Dreissena polymorpha]